MIYEILYRREDIGHMRYDRLYIREERGERREEI